MYFSFMSSLLTLVFFVTELLLANLVKGNSLLVSTCGEKINSLADLTYVNGIPLRCTPVLSNVSAKRRCYGSAYDICLRLIDWISPSMIISNSEFTRLVIRKCMKRETPVIHPPVDLRRILCEKESAAGERGNVVVVASRFLPDQDLNRVLEIAKKVENIEFKMVGPAGSSSEETIDYLKKKILDLGLNSRVQILTNQPSSIFRELLLSSKVFLRTLPHESFGISVIEAMAAGCVPVVPMDGGPWFDILEQKQGFYGYAFRDDEEASRIIRSLMDNENLRAEVSSRSFERALKLARPVFEETIPKILKAIR
jgi:glycosyltransferase involved in cell wall biosynthesis